LSLGQGRCTSDEISGPRFMIFCFYIVAAICGSLGQLLF
jgi:hypothetical protein